MDSSESGEPSILPDTTPGQIALWSWFVSMVIRLAITLSGGASWVSDVALIAIFICAVLALWSVIARHDRGVMLWLPIIYGTFFAVIVIVSRISG